METTFAKLKSFLVRLKWLAFALVIVIVEQSALLLVKKGQALWQTLLLALLMLVISGVTYWIAKKVNLVGGKTLSQKDSKWLWIGLGTLALFVIKMIGGIILIIEKGPNASTANQTILEEAGLHPLLLLVLVVVLAPIMEEIVFRGLLFGKLFGPKSIIGLFLSSFLFGLFHGPTDIGSWVIYGGMGLMLGFVYYRTEKLSYTMSIHFLNNAIAAIFLLIAMFLKLK
ncbi:CPBP family intramembrane glutamic endopeptidase [Streptococcus ictaluri]|uniref:CAAX amino terminal protease family protein n=1 Tax=Streptococcus ictaluri 707-05 TaxID=764299 RepID=G5K4L8_9STRE|nr:type II CAAX endopeptidase family protein [Streptococcus ictaluri]EHI69150.1 CAAX amino terminal protease family protein [Streptococcus ictaluri 707-05]